MTRKLCPREIQVLDLLVDAVPSKEIAARLGLSPKTVSEYSKGIRNKLGFSSVTQAVHAEIRRRTRLEMERETEKRSCEYGLSA